MSVHELDQWTRDILWQVCHSGPYSSSVILAIDLSDLNKLVDSLDAVPLLEMALEALNELGLIIYREPVRTEYHEHGRAPLTRIRATQTAYDEAGFAPPVKIVGARYSRGSHASDHPGDRTDWRNQTQTAAGGEVERLPIREHMAKYWDHAHAHFAALRELEERKDRR